MLFILSIFQSILFIILLTYYYYYYYYYYYSYFPIFILENLRTINYIKSVKAIGIKPCQKLCHKYRIIILKQDSCMQIDNNDQDYESAEETANKCKELCRENVNQNVGPLLFFSNETCFKPI